MSSIKFNRTIFDPDKGFFFCILGRFDVAGAFMLTYFVVLLLARHCLLKNILALHFRILDLKLIKMNGLGLTSYKFNAFHTVVLRFNLLETVKHNKYIRSQITECPLYRVSHELRSLLRESVPYVKVYRYNPKHLYPKLNGYGDNGQRSLKL